MKQKKERIDNTQLLKDTSLRIRHYNLDTHGVRAMTVAFREGSSTIEIATAIVHPKDKFCRKVGTKLAVESFVAGNVIKVPRAASFFTAKGLGAIRTLDIMFG